MLALTKLILDYLSAQVNWLIENYRRISYSNSGASPRKVNANCFALKENLLAKNDLNGKTH